MSTLPALHLAGRYAEDDADAPTEATDIASAFVLATEVSDDDETVATAPVASRPRRTHRPAMVAVGPEVPDPSALSPRTPSPERPTPDLELLVLQQDNLRLQRAAEHTARQINDLRVALEGARRASRDATEQAQMWKRVARETEEALTHVARVRDHYQAFAEQGLWERIRGCPPPPSAPEGGSTHD